MAAAASKHSDLVVRKIDVKSWKSPVAKQFHIRSLPTFMLYDNKGKLVEQGSSVYQRVMKWKPAKSGSSSSTRSGSSSSKKGSSVSAVRKRVDLRGTGKKRVRKVSKYGERVNFKLNLTPGRYTLFEFYADWSKESTKRAPELQKAVKKTYDLDLCRIRVKSMKSPVAVQHKVKSIPYFVLFDRQGKIVKQGPDLIDDILEWNKFKAARPQR